MNIVIWKLEVRLEISIPDKNIEKEDELIKAKEMEIMSRKN